MGKDVRRIHICHQSTESRYFTSNGIVITFLFISFFAKFGYFDKSAMELSEECFLLRSCAGGRIVSGSRQVLIEFWRYDMINSPDGPQTPKISRALAACIPASGPPTQRARSTTCAADHFLFLPAYLETEPVTAH
jgi:hypothetical protein